MHVAPLADAAVAVHGVAGTLGTVFAAVTVLTAAVLAASAIRRRRPPERGWFAVAGTLCGGATVGLSALLGLVTSAPTRTAPVAIGLSVSGFLLLGALIRLSGATSRGEVLRDLLDGALLGGAVYLTLWDLAIEPAHRSRTGGAIPGSALADCAPVAAALTVALLVAGTAAVLVTHTDPGRRTMITAGAVVTGTTVVAVLVGSALRYAGPIWVLLAAVGYAVALLSLGRLGRWLSARPRPVPDLTRPQLLIGLTPVLIAIPVAAARRIFLGPADPVGLGLVLSLAVMISIRQAFTLTDLRRVLRRYRHDAHTDALTGLPNRRSLLELINEREPPHTLILIDLDGFKSVNDIRGHVAGDRVLCEVALRLRRNLPPGAVAARLGGDEFAVLLATGPEAAGPVAEALRAALAEPVDLDGAWVYLSASLGLAGRTAPDELHGLAPVEDLDRMLANADVALRFAKQRGKNRVENYAVADGSWLRRRTAVEQALRGAAERGELSLVFQPVMQLPAGRPVGVETLLRWTHPQLGVVPPDEFIPIAEDAGLVSELDRWVLHQACHQLREWVRGGYELWVAVNISVRDLQQPGYVRRVLRMLREHELPPSQLVLEVTEHAVALDPEVVSGHLSELRALGVRIALDDFGAGYSSLGALRTLPVDIVKIDRALLVEPLLDISVQLGKRLGKLVIAEGIADAALRAAVERTGCPLGQGSALCRPLPAGAVTALLTPAVPIPGQRHAQHAGQVDSTREMRQS